MIRVHGTGCCLIDFLYPKTDFSSPAFKACLSKKTGDGGLGIGKLVFAEDFERFTGRSYENALSAIAGGKPSHNLGGPSVVSLVHASQVLGAKAEVSFYGVRGNDETGDLVEEALSRITSIRYKLKRVDAPTPRTDVLSDPSYDNGHGERTFINLIGAAGHFFSEDVDEDFFDADIVSFGGTGLTPPIHDSLTELLRKAKDKKALTMVNLVFDFRSEQSAPEQKWKLGVNDDAYSYIDLLLADRDEALKTSGRDKLDDALSWFLEKGCGGVVITEGSRPVRIGAAANKTFSPLPIQTLPVSAAVDRELAAHPEKRGDTTGCGDNFVGGVIAGMAEQLEKSGRREASPLDLREACIPGIVAGGFACFTLGGVFYEKTSGEKQALLLPFLNEYKKEIPSNL